MPLMPRAACCWAVYLALGQVFATTSWDAPVPFIAPARYGAGRVLSVGCEGMMPTLTWTGLGRLLSNAAIRVAAASSDTKVGSLGPVPAPGQTSADISRHRHSCD